jgi:dTDP-4-dehydrorhamnose reductase
MTSNVLVTGASGLLGRQVFSTFQHSGVLVVGQGFTRAAPPTILKADLEKEADIKNILTEVKSVHSLPTEAVPLYPLTDH